MRGILGPKPLGEQGQTLWIVQNDSTNLGMGLLELCDLVVSEYAENPSLAEQALIAVLVSGFEDPKDLLTAAINRMHSGHVLIPMQFTNGEFQFTME